jgi:transaldolase
VARQYHPQSPDHPNLLNGGALQRYIDAFSVTGITSNPTIFDHAIRNSADYDRDISE